MKENSVIIDTNIWIYYLNKDSKFHKKSKEVITAYIETKFDMFITSQIYREMLVVLTSVKFLEKPLSPEAATEKVKEILELVTVLFETEESNNKLSELISENQINGYKIHDANIIAVGLQNEIESIRTNNTKDFPESNGIKVHGLNKNAKQ